MGLAATFRLMRAGFVLAREGALSVIDPKALPPVMKTGIRIGRLFERASVRKRGPVEDPQTFVRALRTHRLMREEAILARIRAGDRSIADMVKVIYATTDPRLHGAAALSVLAHLEDLVERGQVVTEGAPRLLGDYRPG